MNKLVVAGAAVVIAPLVAVLGIASAMTGAAATVPGQCGAGGPGARIGAVDLSAEQLANAQTIVSTTQQAGLPTYAAVVAVATAMTESTLHNSSSQTDHDSEGLFQQRVSIYTEAVAINPVAATQAFLSRLVGVPNWQTIPLTEAAADVQIPRADLRGRYAQWESLGSTIAARYWPGTAGATAPTCSGDGGSGLPLSGGGIPAGFTLPADSMLAAVVGYALAQLGKPYVYAAEGPDSFDCSGLVMAAWAQGGVALPRTTYNQVNVGTPVGSLQAMSPGDLIFIAGSDGTNANPGHVGMYIGAVDGKQYLVHAPQTGEVVKVATVSSWGSEIVDVRHPGGAA